MILPRFTQSRSFAAAAIAALLATANPSHAQTVFNFDGPTPLTSPLISGDVSNFVVSTTQALSSPNSIRFVDNSPEPYESWTYDLPTGFLNGTVSLWFRSDIDATPLLDANTWGASFLIEDADAPQDFGAVEISNSTFGPNSRFWASEGTGDRLIAADTFDSNSLPTRDANWHQVVFTITPSITTIAVDGVEADEVAAPGSEISAGVPRKLRFRHLAGSPKNGGFSNWITNPNPASATTKAARNRVFIDDFQVVQTAPTASTASIGFEIVSGVADFDTPVIQSVAPKNNVAAQRGFVNKFRRDTTPANVRTGSGSATFDPGTKRLRKLVFDLASANPGTISLKFYDALGPNTGQNKFGGSIVIQSGVDPSSWIAAEIWNFNFPQSSDPTPGAPNYYLSRSTSPTAATFGSRYFGDRSVGWQTVEIDLTATTSKIRVNGIENSNGAGILTGPGLNTNPKLLLIADSASQGGFVNFVGVDELDALYDDSATVTDDYVYFDDLSLPITSTNVQDWTVY